MNKECHHEWHDINPFQQICCNCNAVTTLAKMERCVKKEFLKLYPNIEEEIGEIFSE